MACGKHTVSTDSIVLLQLRRKRWHFKNNRPGLWSEVGWLRECVRLLGHPKTFPEGKVPTESAEEGMRRELAVEEPTETAGNLAFYASSVSTSAATFPIGEGLVRRILNDANNDQPIQLRHCLPGRLIIAPTSSLVAKVLLSSMAVQHAEARE